MNPLPALVFAVPLAAPAPAPQASPAPERYVIRDVRLGLADDAPHRTLVLEGGRIVDVLEPGATEPAGARLVEGEGRIALPAFVDAFTTTGCETPEPLADPDLPVPIRSDPRIDMRVAGRKGLQPSFRAAEALALEPESSEKWRASGFGSLLASPSGELLSGTSVLATTREAAMRDLVMVEDVFANAGFSASGRGYPSTLMGFAAQLRQFFMDAQRHAELEERYDAGRPGPRPPFDADLESILPALAGHERVACRADAARDIELWIDLADEHGLEIVIVGGREAWRVRDVLAERSIPVILTLDWGEEVDDPHEKDEKEEESGEEEEGVEAPDPEGEEPEEEIEEVEEEVEPQLAYEEPLGVREERYRLWTEKRDCALRLSEAGVDFAFGSADGSAGDLLKKVRTLVEVGLAPDVALAGLSSRAAAILDVERRLGALEAGRDATLAVWTESPFEKKAKPAWLFVDGFAHEFDVEAEEADGDPPDEGVDATGTWSLSMEGQAGTRSGKLELTMEEDGAVSGTLTSQGFDGSDTSTSVEGRVSGKSLHLKAEFEMEGMQITTTIDAELDGDTLSGESVSKLEFGEFESKLTGTRDPRAQKEVRR